MASENYTILHYTLGDPSDNGHGKTSVGHIRVNHTNEELAEAMKKFVAATGCDWELWVREYEESTIPPEDTEKISQYLNDKTLQDFEVYDADEYYDEDEYKEGDRCIYLDESTYVALLMRICKVALPDLDWSWWSPESQQAFFDGHGYGLFY